MRKSAANKLTVTRWFRSKFGGRELLALITATGISLGVIALYDPLLDYASWGYIGIFLIALIGNASIILPAPVLLVVVATGATLGSPLFVGLTAGLGATLGETTGYLAGYSGNRVLEYNAKKQRIQKSMQERGFWYVLALAFLPNPLFDAVGIIAGALRYPWKKFFLAALVGKTVKMIIAAYAGLYSVAWLEAIL